MEKSLTC